MPAKTNLSDILILEQCSTPIQTGPFWGKAQTGGPRLLKIEAVVDLIPFSHSQVYGLIAGGQFPAPVHLGGRSSFWVEAEINEWIQAHIDAERRVE